MQILLSEQRASLAKREVRVSSTEHFELWLFGSLLGISPHHLRTDIRRTSLAAVPLENLALPSLPGDSIHTQNSHGDTAAREGLVHPIDIQVS